MAKNDLSKFNLILVDSAEIFIAAYRTPKNALRPIPGSGRVIKVNDDFFYYDNNSHWAFDYTFPWLRGKKPYNAWKVDENWLKRVQLYKSYEEYRNAARKENPTSLLDEEGFHNPLGYSFAMGIGKAIAPVVMLLVGIGSSAVFGEARVEVGLQAIFLYLISTLFWAVLIFGVINIVRDFSIKRFGFEAAKSDAQVFIKLGTISEKKTFVGSIVFFGIILMALGYLLSGKFGSGIMIVWWNIFYLSILSGFSFTGLWSIVLLNMDRHRDFSGINLQIASSIKEAEKNVQIFVKN